MVVRLLHPPEARTVDELHTRINDVSPERVDAAIVILERAGVVQTTGQGISATGPIRHLDALGLVCP